ncbi:MAG: DUF3888 domain-containing protein [Ectobacillus sp.]
MTGLFWDPLHLQAQQSPEMLEDALYSVLFPQINRAIEKHYGTLKKYDCPKIVHMKKMYSGTYMFEAKIEVIKYEGRMDEPPGPPFDRVTITFNNEEGEWTVQHVSVQRLPDSTELNCRKPM